LTLNVPKIGPHLYFLIEIFFKKKENSLNEIIFLKGLYDERSKTTVTLSLSRLRCLPPVQTLEYEQTKLVLRT